MKEEYYINRISQKELIEEVDQEISVAIEAKKSGKPLPELKTLGLILLEQAFDKLPPETWNELCFLLAIPIPKNKRGRPSAKEDDIVLANKYYRLRHQGMSDAEAITDLAKQRKHTDSRSTRKALARGKKLRAERFKDYVDSFPLPGLLAVPGIYETNQPDLPTDKKD